MHRGLVMMLLVGIAGCRSAPSPPTGPRTSTARIVYVSTLGSDAWSGTVPEPNPMRTDGPFATLERARDASRMLRAQHRDVEIVIRGGTYELSSTLRLTREDSGTAHHPVTWRNYEREVVRLVGSRRLSGFKPVTDPAMLSRLGSTARGKVVSTKLAGISDVGSPAGGGVELFVDGTPLTLARWPNRGFVTIDGVSSDDPIEVRGRRGTKTGRFKFVDARTASWASEPDIWVHGYWFWDWADDRSHVERVDSTTGELVLAPPYHPYGYRAGQWFYAYNLLSEIDEPGEWYLERSSGTLFLWPVGQATVTASVLPTLIELRDASFVRFEGLDLGEVRQDVITVHGGRSVTLDHCKVGNAGGWGVRFEGGSHHEISSSELSGTGAGAIMLHGGDRATLTPAAHVARSNDIHDFSRWFRTRKPGIDVDGVGNRVENNRIHDAPHQAIWFRGNDHVIDRNDISNVCTETIDAGAIYAGRDWTMRGNIISHNFLHQLRGLDGKGCVAVYLDDMFSGTTVTNNVFSQIDKGILVGGGRDNVIEDNLFVDCRTAISVDARALGWAAGSLDTLKQSLARMPVASEPWQARYPSLHRLLDDVPAAPKGNVIKSNASVRCELESIDDRARPYVRIE